MARSATVLVLLAIASVAFAAGVVDAQSPAPTRSPTATCPPDPDRISVPPAGAAWIGNWGGVFDYPAGPMASWDIEEVLMGDVGSVDEVMTYPQPPCAPILTGSIGERFLVSTADASAPTTDDSVVWQLGAHGHASLISTSTSGTYDVGTLSAARALVMSGAMPADPEPTPAPPSTCSLDASPSSSPAPSPMAQVTLRPTDPPDHGVTHVPDPAADKRTATRIVRQFERHILDGRPQTAYRMLAPGHHPYWRDVEAFSRDAWYERIASVANAHAAICIWVTDLDLSELDLTRAWIVEMANDPGTNSGSVFLVAPDIAGTWQMVEVR